MVRARAVWVSWTVALVALQLALASCGGGDSAGQPRMLPPDAASTSIAPALAELDALETPDGVDAALFAQLKAALASQLESRLSSRDYIGGAGVSPANHLNHGRDARATSGVPYKFVSTPPAGEPNEVNDLDLIEDGGTYSLVWHYRNLGDYNQDGAVDIGDVTPLAIHFGEAVPEGDDDSLQAVIDGSGNRSVDIADVTPIAINFGVEVAGYAMEASANEGVNWFEETQVPIANAAGEGRKAFSLELTDPIERSLYQVIPFDSGEIYGDASNAARYFTGELLLLLATPAESGAGTQEDPYVVHIDTPYELRVEDNEAVDVSAEAGFATYPPAFISFTAEMPRLMTVEDVMAGEFWVVGLLGEIAPMETDKLYFRVLGDLPP